MITSPARFLACAAAVLALPLSPAAAAPPPGGFTLPEPTPTPTPAPAGPADERAGVVIPPRVVPAPRITPAPMLTPEATPMPSPAPTSAPRPLALPPAPVAPRSATPAPAPLANAPETAAPTEAAPGEPPAIPPAFPSSLPSRQTDLPAPVLDTPENADPQTALPTWWPWAAGVLGGLAVLGGGLLLWRRRAPKAVRLAPLPPGMAGDAPVPDLPRLDLTLDITGATRSVMMFTLQYRLQLANRTDRAVSDLTTAVQLACAQRGGSNAPSPGAAQQLQTIDRIGPHQIRSITGTVQLPVSELAILRQGSAALFIPLAHVTVEGEGQTALTRSFVIGTPSASGAGKLHPILLDTPPGSIPGLRAQSIAVPAMSAAA